MEIDCFSLLASKSVFLIPNSLIHIPYLERVPDGLLAQVSVDSHHGNGLLASKSGFPIPHETDNPHALPLESA
jgi:hypothetical protein